MKHNNAPYRETLILAVGEAVVSLLVLGGFGIASLATQINFLSVILGAVLGSSVTVINFFALSFYVNRSVDKYLELRGTREMTDEEAEKFTLEHSMQIQNAIKTNYIIRTVLLLVALVLAFLVKDLFNPIATVIPLLAYRPILTAGEIIRAKFNKAPNPDNIVVYDNEKEGWVEISSESNDTAPTEKEEKESD